MNRIRPTSPVATDGPDHQRTLLLIRRVLCTHSPPTTPLEQLLPALTSSAEVDVQLYGFIAILARDFVLSWYGEISTDHAFVDEIVALMAHCTRSLEERLRKVDVEMLLLDEVPAILDAHVRDYRRAVERHNTALAPHLSLPEIFRSYQPHPAFPNSAASTASTERLYLKFVSNGMLALLLPTEDLESDCERSLLREMLSSLVFGNVLDRLSEPFMIYELIGMAVGHLRPDLLPQLVEVAAEPASARRGSAKPGARLTSPPPPVPPPPAAASLPPPPPPPPPPPSPPPWHFTRIRSTLECYWRVLVRVLGAVWSVLASLHHLLLLLLDARPPPSPLLHAEQRRPLVRTALPSCLFTLLNIRALQPWLPATLRLLSKPFESRATVLGALLDDILMSKISPRLSSAELVVNVLKTARSSLFPGDALAPSRPHPSGSEQARIRRATEHILVAAVPERMRAIWSRGLDRDEMASQVARNWLDPFGDKEINKVLIVRLLDLAVGRVLPELLESGGAEIRKQRSGPVLQPSADPSAKAHG